MLDKLASTIDTKPVGPRFNSETPYGRASSGAGYFPGYEARSERLVVETDRIAVELGSSYAPKLHALIEMGLITV